MDMPSNNAPSTLGNITEYPLNWPADGRHIPSDNHSAPPGLPQPIPPFPAQRRAVVFSPGAHAARCH